MINIYKVINFDGTLENIELNGFIEIYKIFLNLMMIIIQNIEI